MQFRTVFIAAAATLGLMTAAAPAQAWELIGTKQADHHEHREDRQRGGGHQGKDLGVVPNPEIQGPPEEVRHVVEEHGNNNKPAEERQEGL